LALYVCLAEAGFFSMDELWGFTRPHRMLGGEPTLGIMGVETATGSLGHGLSYGAGVALGLKRRGSKARTFVLIGDGECEEGSIWEAAGFASAQRLDGLTAILDCNGLQKMDLIQNVYGVPNWAERWQSFGWQVTEADGHDLPKLVQTLSTANPEGKPRLILAHTIKGKGSAVMENQINWHYRLPSKRELKTICAELDITQEEVEHAKSLY
ncbi:MAG: thiamine pyrophosphate-dependent enzyme, partial [Clostridia bacterium]